jgi:uncharacterized FlaG/YvyC family protein
MQIDPLNSLSALPAIEPVRNNDPAITRQLATAVRALNKSDLYGQDRQLEFARDPTTKMMVIRLVQPNTGEVLEQIPPETVLRAFESLQQLQAKEAKK